MGVGPSILPIGYYNRNGLYMTHPCCTLPNKSLIIIIIIQGKAALDNPECL